jgi:hypothetical protein
LLNGFVRDIGWVNAELVPYAFSPAFCR